MSAQQNILREYLVTLGFKINTTEKRAMDRAIGLLDKRMFKLGGAIATAATTFVTAGVAFANAMQKMYYDSRYAGTTIENLEGVEFGAKRIGLSAGKATALMKGMAAAIRGNPGLEGFLNANGVATVGRDMKDVFQDFIEMTKRYPTFIANKMGEMFGIGPEDLFNLQQGLDKMKEQEKLRAQWAKEMGVDADAAQKASEAIGDKWGEIVERSKLFGQYLLFASQGPLTTILGTTIVMLENMVKLVKEWEKILAMDPATFQGKMVDGLRQVLGLPPVREKVELNADTKARLGAPVDANPFEGNTFLQRALHEWWDWRDKRGSQRSQYRMPTDAAAVDAASSPGWQTGGTPRGLLGAPRDNDPALLTQREELLRQLEKMYGLPEGLLDRVWQRESSRGTNMLSPKGAMGHFGFMPKTGKAYGINDQNDANNFDKSADASASMWADLLKQYGGNVRLASAAYNWGSGHVDDYLKQVQLGKEPQMPPETQKYMDAVGGPGVTINQDVHITVQGADSPNETARAVAAEQRAVNAEVTRNFQPRVR